MAKKRTEAQQKYIDGFRELMIQKKTEELEDRLRILLFAIRDPDCPLHMFKDKITVPDVIDLLGASPDYAREIRHAMELMGGPFGILDTDKISLIAKPETYNLNEIQELRLQLEVHALVKLHEFDVSTTTGIVTRENAIAKLACANREIEQLQRITGEVKNIEERIKDDPEVGNYAEDFWMHDLKFHTRCSKAMHMNMNKDVLDLILKRARLSRSSRLEIIKRLPDSIKQHQAIIKAVEATPKKGSREAIKKAVAVHLGVKYDGKSE